MRNVAAFLAALGRHADALKLREETLPLQKTKLGPDHPETLSDMINLASIPDESGRIPAMPSRRSWSRPSIEKIQRVRWLAVVQAGSAQDQHTPRPGVGSSRSPRGPRTQKRRTKPRDRCLRPSKDPAEPRSCAGPWSQAVDINKGEWELLALGMAEFRNGHFAAADEALVAASKAGKDANVAGIAAFYRAMSLFQQGKKDEARKLATEAAAKMKPLPKDEQNPLLDGATSDHLVLWLAYKEAKAMIGFDPPAAPAAADGK